METIGGDKVKTESNLRPATRFQINELPNQSEIVLYDNIVDISTEDCERYVFDVYILNVDNKENLQSDVESNFTAWLEKAKQNEYDFFASKVRAERNRLLADTDWIVNRATELNQDIPEIYITYRQALRDITKQVGFPFDVAFPNLP